MIIFFLLLDHNRDILLRYWHYRRHFAGVIRYSGTRRTASRRPKAGSGRWTVEQAGSGTGYTTGSPTLIRLDQTRKRRTDYSSEPRFRNAANNGSNVRLRFIVNIRAPKRAHDVTEQYKWRNYFSKTGDAYSFLSYPLRYIYVLYELTYTRQASTTVHIRPNVSPFPKVVETSTFQHQIIASSVINSPMRDNTAVLAD